MQINAVFRKGTPIEREQERNKADGASEKPLQNETKTGVVLTALNRNVCMMCVCVYPYRIINEWKWLRMGKEIVC